MSDISIDVSFAIKTTKISPKELTQILGVSPTTIHRIGDARKSRAGILHWDFNLWRISSVALESSDVEEHCVHLLSFLSPHEEKIKSVMADPDSYVEFRIWYDSNGGVGSFTLSGKTLSSLSVLCHDLNVSLVG